MPLLCVQREMHAYTVNTLICNVGNITDKVIQVFLKSAWIAACFTIELQCSVGKQNVKWDLILFIKN